MRVKLFEGVELRSDYSIVFDTSENFWGVRQYTPFYRYLETKSYHEAELETAYFANQGTITIDWDVYRSMPQGITYMEISGVDTYPSLWYYFVEDYEYMNGMLRLTYSLDVWHTFSEVMNIHRGVINRARYGLVNYRHALPAAYTSNEPLTFSNSLPNECYIIAEISFYLVNKADDALNSTTRYNRCCLLTHNAFSLSNLTENVTIQAPQTITSDTQFTFTLEEAQNAINTITAYQGVPPIPDKKVKAGWFKDVTLFPDADNVKPMLDKIDIYDEIISPTLANIPNLNAPFEVNATRLNYEIIQLYTVPTSFVNTHDFVMSVGGANAASLLVLDEYEYYAINNSTDDRYNLYFKEFGLVPIASNEGITEATINIAANPSIVGTGLKNLFMPYSYNGLARTFKTRIQMVPTGFSISLITDAGIVDMTQDFSIPIPFTTQSASEKQLAALNYQQNRTSAGVTLATMAATVAAGSMGSMISASYGLAEAQNSQARVNRVAKGATEMQRQIIKGKGWLQYSLIDTPNRLKAAQENYDAVMSQGGNTNAASLIYAGGSLINSLYSLATPLASGDATAATSTGLINAIYGFGFYTITPNNSNEMNTLISRVGYDTFISTNDYHHGLTSEYLNGKYEPIMFATCEVNGSFPNAISNILEGILQKGVIMSYDADIYERL